MWLPGGKKDQNTSPPDVMLGQRRNRKNAGCLCPPTVVLKQSWWLTLTFWTAAGRDYTFDTDKDFRIAVLGAMPARSDVEDTSDPAYDFNGRNGNTFWKSSITPVMPQITEHQWRVFGMAI
ncbi:hypothetical protein P4S64_18310 [Vibrio sp. M60_M31a]